MSNLRGLNFALKVGDMIDAYQAEYLNNDMNSVGIKTSDLKLGNYAR